jgi:phenylpropionate dioxygenase-like ring-hydroxylating dioxygenase large terminal subunit
MLLEPICSPGVGMAPQLLAGLRSSIGEPSRNFSLPPLLYHDPAAQALEAARIFGTGWVALGRADQVASPGDYKTLEIAGRPTILLRDQDGQLRAMANTCRHRGAELLSGCGSTRSIRCPFHGWGYRLDGSLAATTHMQDCSDFITADFGLHQYHVAQRYGMAFISFDERPSDIDEWLNGFDSLHAPWNLDDWHTTRCWTRSFDCDWKAFIDVFNEYYHLPYVHRESIDSLYQQPDPPTLVAGAFASQFGRTQGRGGLLPEHQTEALPTLPGLDSWSLGGVMYTWIFPNLTFAVGADAMWMYVALPDGPGQCSVTQHVCFPPSSIALPDFEDTAALYYERFDAALEEDIPALEGQGRGMRSPEARQGRFSPLLEVNVSRFASWYAARMLSVE